MKRCLKLLPIFYIIIISQLMNTFCSQVRVRIYDHRAYHDPIHWYGKGPWKYFGHGYGIDYGYDMDGSATHEKGYGFIKAFGREFCKDGNRCRPPDPNFWKATSLTANGFSPEPYWARPPADVMEPRVPQTVPKAVPDINYMTDSADTIYWKQYLMQ